MSLRFLLAALLLTAGPALAEDRAGVFDFYVLSLSWAPTYCAADGNPDPASCRRQARGFEVHGFWPEFESGYPADCSSNEAQWLDKRVFDRVADIMPSLGLAGYQWRKHGICAGLSQSAYFALMRKAFDAIRIPAAFTKPRNDTRTSPQKIEEAFLGANPAFSTRSIAVTCHNGMLNSVNICLSKTLGPRDCAAVDRDSCPLSTIGVPAVH